MSRGPADAVRLLASVGVLALLAMLTAFPGASAGGQNPGPPNPSSSDAQAALSIAKSVGNAYAETFQFTQRVVPMSTSCGAGCFALSNAFANVSDPTISLPVGTFTGTATYSITQLQGGATPFTISCDGTPVPSPSGSIRCLKLQLLFGGIHEPGIPIYQIQRIQQYVVPQGQVWIATASGAAMTSQVESWPATIFGSLTNLRMTSWKIPIVSWAVMLPSGTYNLGATQIQFLNTSTFLTTSQFSVQSSWILVQWFYFITSTCLTTCQPPSSSASVLRYQITLEDQGTPIIGSGGIIPPLSPNTTITSTPVPGTSSINTPVSIQLGNLSSTGGRNYTAVMFWQNRYSFPVLGPFGVVSWLFHSATNVTVTANGAPVPTSGYGISNTTLTIYPGSVTVPNGSTVAFAISFHYVPTFDPLSTLFFLNGFAVTTADVLVVGFAGLAGILIAADANVPSVRRYRFIETVEGLAMATSLVLAVLYF